MNYVTCFGDERYHVWDSMRSGTTKEWPCGASTGSQNPAACGHERDGFVAHVEDSWDSLVDFIEDPDTCPDCARAVAARHNLPDSDVNFPDFDAPEQTHLTATGDPETEWASSPPDPPSLLDSPGSAIPDSVESIIPQSASSGYVTPASGSRPDFETLDLETLGVRDIDPEITVTELEAAIKAAEDSGEPEDS